MILKWFDTFFRYFGRKLEWRILSSQDLPDYYVYFQYYLRI